MDSLSADDAHEIAVIAMQQIRANKLCSIGNAYQFELLIMMLLEEHFGEEWKSDDE